MVLKSKEIIKPSLKFISISIMCCIHHLLLLDYIVRKRMRVAFERRGCI